MKVTAIKQQIRRAGRYSIFVEGKYAFSLGDTALLQSKLVTGQELTEKQVSELKQLSSEDKLYNMTIQYIALRSRTKWEIKTYLERKKASPALVDTILNKLSVIGLIDDKKFARAYVNDRQLLRPTSRRKIILELRKKHIADSTIQEVMGLEINNDKQALRAIIEIKRRQAKYKDNLKLMQYLARQGFNYGDIKDALNNQ